jgi:hypothetical protein
MAERLARMADSGKDISRFPAGRDQDAGPASFGSETECNGRPGGKATKRLASPHS